MLSSHIAEGERETNTQALRHENGLTSFRISPGISVNTHVRIKFSKEASKWSFLTEIETFNTEAFVINYMVECVKNSKYKNSTQYLKCQ